MCKGRTAPIQSLAFKLQHRCEAVSISETDPEFVTALARGLSVIRAFDKGFEELTLSEVAGRTGLNRAAARRFLLTLEALGYVRQSGRLFRLTPKVLDLGYSYLQSVPLWEKALPYMKEIVDQVDESCSLAVLSGPDVVYLARVPPRHVYTIPVHVGTRMPAYVNSMGRVLLAELSASELDAYFAQVELQKLNPHTRATREELLEAIREVREKGYALIEHELHEGRCSIAVPVRDRSGKAVAGINISALMSRKSRDHFLGTLLPLLKEAAKQIGASA